MYTNIASEILKQHEMKSECLGKETVVPTSCYVFNDSREEETKICVRGYTVDLRSLLILFQSHRADFVSLFDIRNE